jgi:NADH-quinone oxidoreductase subunit L
MTPIAPASWGLPALVPLLPLGGAAILGVAGARIQRRLGKPAVAWIACGTVVASFVLSLVGFIGLLRLPPAQRLVIADLFPWIHVASLNVDVAFALDPLSAVMILVVTGIGGLIHFYSVGYMHDDDGFWRFFAYLNLFTFAMLTLVLGDNLLLMFVGWEGVGFCSWALIGFWHKEKENTTAGNKAFIVNRIGDFGFVLGIFLLFWTLDAAGRGTLVFRELVVHAPVLAGQHFWGVEVATLVTLLLFVGATGKSAQIPLYVWLPDAMAGPTPVSALIHAATMVTAGVYMIGRLNFLFAMAPATLWVIACVGAATALVAAAIALAQNDIKKVLAYSTVSQLGYMFLSMGVGAWAAGIFHLLTHAFFKACLFLGSGSVIHAMGGEQDMRKMGGLWSKMPQTGKTFLIATLALTGCPFFAGFFSKDEILWQAFSSPHGHFMLWAVGTAVAGMTAFYMFRQVFMVFAGECRADEHTRHHLHESPPIMTIPLWVLAVGSVLSGYLALPHVLGGPIGIENLFHGWLEPVMGGHEAVAAAGHGAAHATEGREALELGLMLVSVSIAFAGFGLAWLMYYRRSLSPEVFGNLLGGVPYRIVLNKFYVDELYWAVFVIGGVALCRIVAWIDLRIIDGIVNLAAAVTRVASWLVGVFDQWVVDGAVNGVAATTQAAGRRIRSLQTGAINWYLYVILFGVIGGVLLYRSLAMAS